MRNNENFSSLQRIIRNEKDRNSVYSNMTNGGYNGMKSIKKKGIPLLPAKGI